MMDLKYSHLLEGSEMHWDRERMCWVILEWIQHMLVDNQLRPALVVEVKDKMKEVVY
jgi:hypothetical protein